MNDIINIKELKQHILTGISYFIPLVVGAGLTMAIGRAMAGSSVANLGDSGIGYWLYQTGSLGMQLMVPMLCAYIAFSMAASRHWHLALSSAGLLRISILVLSAVWSAVS